MADKKQSRRDPKTTQEDEEAQQRSAPSGVVVYKAILSEGNDELQRPSSALFWSGLAAGLSMGFSMITEGLLRAHLPSGAAWTPLVSKFGYSIGFLMVILGRQQLFTENTLTPILPLLRHRNRDTLFNVARLWTIVLIANLVGALAVGFVAARTNVFDPPIRRMFVEIGYEAISHAALTVLWRSVFAGWLIALMVWLLPFAEVGRIWIIIIITYVVGIGHFSHVIAGAVVVFALAAAGEAGWLHVVLHFLIPALVGNIIGGVTLVAALNHAQVVSGGDGLDV